MSATETALRVLTWAVSSPLPPDVPDGPPPLGSLRDAHELARPDPALAGAVGRLAALTAGRLRLGWPPLGDPEPLSAWPGLLAFALGTRDQPEVTFHLLLTVPHATGPAEWVARHGVIAPALEYLHPVLAEEFLLRSPLTALLGRPVVGQEGDLFDLVARFLDHPAGRLALQMHLAAPTDDLTTRQWRLTLLDRLRLAGEEGAAFVLDVYEAAVTHHLPELLEQIREARAVLADPRAARDEDRLNATLSVARWWGPLRALERNRPQALRDRRYLGYDYRRGIALYRLAQRMTGDL